MIDALKMILKAAAKGAVFNGLIPFMKEQAAEEALKEASNKQP